MNNLSPLLSYHRSGGQDKPENAAQGKFEEERSIGPAWINHKEVK